jgi:hypothetical protein
MPAPAGDALILEALNRLRAELTLAGMRAVPSDSPSSPVPERAPDFVPERAPDFVPEFATITISRADDARVAVAVSVGAGNSSALVRQTIIGDAQGADGASVLAIRAVELLRATLMQATTVVLPPPPAVRVPEPPGRSTAPSPAAALVLHLRWAVALGPALLRSFAGFGSAVGGTARVSFRPIAPLGIEVQAAGPMWARDLTATAGSASVRQELAFAGVTWFLRDGHRLSPIASAGAGLYHVQVTGHAANGAAVSGALWAPLASTSVGLGVALGSRYALRIDAAALFLQPAPYVLIGASEVGHAGRPLLLLGLTVERHSPPAEIR